MKLDFPSPEFDDVVAAICHGSASNEQALALNDLLRRHSAARDEYILRVELHARLASDPDLFPVATTPQADDTSPSGNIREYPQNVVPLPSAQPTGSGWSVGR